MYCTPIDCKYDEVNDKIIVDVVDDDYGQEATFVIDRVLIDDFTKVTTDPYMTDDPDADDNYSADDIKAWGYNIADYIKDCALIRIVKINDNEFAFASCLK